jgi:recombination protein RecA
LSLSEEQKSVVLGTLLGDGCIHLPRSEWRVQARLIMVHSLDQREYFMYKYSMLRPHMGSVGIIKNGGWGGQLIRASSLTHPYWTGLYHLIYEGRRKKVSPAWLREITHPIGLAVWYMDDGGLTGGLRTVSEISTNAFTFEENQLLVRWLEKSWGVGCHVAPDVRHDQYYILLNSAGRDRFFDLIRPFVIPSMQYKLLEPVPLVTCGICQNQFTPSRFQLAMTKNGKKVMCSPKCRRMAASASSRQAWERWKQSHRMSTT